MHLQVLHSQAQTLVTIGGEEISRSEFERIYLKNNQMLKEGERPSIDEYLELFINYKLKVVEAKTQGLDKDETFIKELEGYRKQLAEPFFTDTETDERVQREAYEMMKYEVDVSHILINVPQSASPADTLDIYNKVLKIRDRIIQGEPFGVVARATSDDPSVVRNDGRIGYFTVFQLVYPFEVAAYKLPVGGLSMPVRTQFGYHLIKVHGKRPARGQVKVAHIMIATSKDFTPEQMDTARNRINEIYKEVLNNEDFATLARKYSEDLRSANKGGEMVWFGVNSMVKEFDSTAFALRDGEISTPIQTPYGWHIVKRLESRPVGTFEEVLPDLKANLRRSGLDQMGAKRFFENKRAKHGFTVDSTLLALVHTLIDSSFYTNSWTKPKYPAERILFKYDGTDYPLSLLMDRIESNRQMQLRMPLGQIVRHNMSQLVDQVVKDVEIKRLEEENPDFRYLMREYFDGILLFDITNSNVWSKAATDTLGLEEFYKSRVDNYRWDTRVYATVFTADSEKVAKNAVKLINSRRGRSLTPDEVVARFSSGTKAQLSHKAFEGEPLEPIVANYKDWKNGVSPVSSSNGQFTFVRVDRVTTNEVKPLDAIRGQVIADYQDYLEKKWVEQLRAKHEVVINKQVLEQIKANLN